MAPVLGIEGGDDLEVPLADIGGLGRIGLLVAQRLSAFGVRLLAYDPYVQPARAAFSMKPGMRWQSVSTCRNSLIGSFSPSRSSISRSKIGSQLRLRAKLSSVTKKRVMPRATFERTICSMSSAER